jgi:hypothetical protein
VDGVKLELSAGRDSDPAVTPAGAPLIRKERSDLRINLLLYTPFVHTNMSKKTIKQSFRIDIDQWSTLQVLSCYGVNISAFIRNAIKEKIQRDWKNIKEKKERIKIPF